jgi:uncharacterized membrane protein
MFTFNGLAIMDVLTAVAWVAGVLVVLGLLLLGFAVLVVGGFLAFKFVTRKAAAAGVDLSDGIDDREKAIILGMLTKHKQTAAEKAAAVAMVNAAQASLNATPKAPA